MGKELKTSTLAAVIAILVATGLVAGRAYYYSTLPSPKVTPSPTPTTPPPTTAPPQPATPTFITTPTPSTDHIVINEFELNPPGNDDDLSVEEWVELYNPTSEDVDIGSWTLSTTHGENVTVSIPQGTVIKANSYYVYSRGFQWLDNEDESIILRDA